MRKLICQNCGQEFTPKQGSDSKNFCPKCFIQKLNHVAANNSGNDPAANKTIMDQQDDPSQPKPMAPIEPSVTPPASPPTGEESVIPPAGGTVIPPGAPAPEEEKKKEEEGGETPIGGETPPATPVV